MIKKIKKFLKSPIKQIVFKILNIFGYTMEESDSVINKDKNFQKIYAKCKGHTMTTRERVYSLYKSIEYIINAGIPGDFVECGVWKGGNGMLIAYTLIELGVTDRKIFLYDTYEGMAEPTSSDYKFSGKLKDAEKKWNEKQKKDHNEWAYASLDEVRRNMASTEYPENKIIFVKGKVEDTIPGTLPNQISLLRLDTDFYESTKQELIHLYPILSKNGVLIIDDYGCWAGSKKAVDEYFKNRQILLNRIDSGARIGIKIT